MVPAMGARLENDVSEWEHGLRELRGTREGGPWEFGAGAVGGQTTDTLDCCVLTDERKRSGTSLARRTTNKKDVLPARVGRLFLLARGRGLPNRILQPSLAAHRNRAGSTQVVGGLVDFGERLVEAEQQVRVVVCR